MVIVSRASEKVAHQNRENWIIEIVSSDPMEGVAIG